jgi:RNA polymerase sigma factor (sigma-70 family)
MVERTDAELVAQARAGDVDAFAALVDRHREAIVRLARRRVVSVDDAQDVAQEAFVSAFQRLETLRDGARFGAWLRQIAVNAARQRWRQGEQLSPEWRVTASLGARDLLAALEEVARFEAFLAASARPDASDDRLRVQFTFAGSSGSVAIESTASKAVPTSVCWRMRAEVPVLLEGAEASARMSISLNRHFLRECLEAMAVAPRESVEILFNSPVSPIMVRPKGDGSRFTLVMPLRPLTSEGVEVAE